MISYLLALGVGLGSLGLYLAAFWFPLTYRKYDLIWSGVGLFYALVLWVCAGRITGGVLVGQLASVALLGWFVWQTLDLRWRQLPIADRPLALATANSFAEVSRIQLKQVQASFDDGSWKLAFYDWLDRSPAQVKVVFKTVQSWIEALLSTTLQPQPLESDRIASRDPVLPPEGMPLEDTAAADFAAAWDDLRLEDSPVRDAPDPQPVSKSETPPLDNL